MSRTPKKDQEVEYILDKLRKTGNNFNTEEL